MLIFIEKLKYELEQKREQSGIEPQTEQFNDEIQADSSNVNSNVQMDTNTWSSSMGAEANLNLVRINDAQYSL